MPKFDIKNIKLRKVTVDELSDKMLLVNLYATQALTFIIGLAWAFLQGQNILETFRFQSLSSFVYWGAGLAALVVAFDIGISRWIPDEAKDDGGVNERIFRNRPLWHIALICAVVSVCEELLFRGAIQHAIGPYWTSIIFAAIHVRYLRHWIPTGMVFAISYGLGWLMSYTGTIWAPILTHFLVDLTMGIIIRYRREEE
ncbi:CPBP family intramembrane glutamic endopeptidase [Cohnella rhizosphaerae]|uniref:CPBP family intramembrane metalloprotease n=1 Tax=Cohnella rhizosphaerae TaxID=1457232 RepID=A0A9X4KYJ6_9BACL|nr:type II CAAX endopeptidase family protein [Cohnella rhizosphaerae]MDG0813138.1 CPBP family intramembrane metalloprotease [Cohnella rhizosphaerae]